MNNTEIVKKLREDAKSTVWDSGELDEIEYIKFQDAKNGEVTVVILDNFPTQQKNKFGVISYDFEVYEEAAQCVKCLRITSKRLMRKLKVYIPLEGKKFSIKRCGEL